jgi:hypothetical protein
MISPSPFARSLRNASISLIGPADSREPQRGENGGGEAQGEQIHVANYPAFNDPGNGDLAK